MDDFEFEEMARTISARDRKNEEEDRDQYNSGEDHITDEESDESDIMPTNEFMFQKYYN